MTLYYSHLTRPTEHQNKAVLLPSVLFKNFPPTLLRESSLLDALLTIQSDRQKHAHTDVEGVNFRETVTKINLTLFLCHLLISLSSVFLTLSVSVCLSPTDRGAWVSPSAQRFGL